MDDIFVYYVDKPSNTSEMIAPCADGYTVYLDVKKDRTRQLKDYLHAVKHIRRGDFDNHGDIQLIEKEAHYSKKQQ